MLGKTHRAFGLTITSTTLLAAYPCLSMYNSNDAHIAGRQVIITLTAACISSTFPDMDRTLLGTTHRGITHALWIPLGILFAAWSIQEHIYLFSLLFGIFCGYMSHLIGDAFSKAGVAWFYPFQQYKRYPNGAFYVKGHRGIFVPLYSVGKSTIVNPVILWYIIAFFTTFFLWARL